MLSSEGNKEESWFWWTCLDKAYIATRALFWTNANMFLFFGLNSPLNSLGFLPLAAAWSGIASHFAFFG